MIEALDRPRHRRRGSRLDRPVRGRPRRQAQVGALAIGEGGEDPEGPTASGLAGELGRAEERGGVGIDSTVAPRRQVAARRAADPPRVEGRLVGEGDPARGEGEARAHAEEVDPFEEEGALLGLEELEGRQVHLRGIGLDLTEVGEDGGGQAEARPQADFQVGAGPGRGRPAAGASLPSRGRGRASPPGGGRTAAAGRWRSLK